MGKSNTDHLFEIAEQQGLKLAIKGRLIALILIGSLMSLSRGLDRAPEFIGATLIFMALGLIHFYLIGSRYDRWWLKYLFVTIDIVLLSLAVALMPPTSEVPLPQIFIFRFDVFTFFFVILAVAAFSFSPGLLVWTGVIGGAGWILAFLFVYLQMESPLNWTDVPKNPTPEQFLDVFLSPDFAAGGSRMQEAALLLLVAVLLAIVMRRARDTVRRQLEAEQEMASVSSIFGRFVPKSIVDSMIANQGALEPIEREATVLFCDIEGFTKLTEKKGPKAIVDTLNVFFDDAAEIIGQHNGVVTQFQGDGILATFNVPAEDERHAQNAFNAALALIQLVADKKFDGETLGIRIGLSTGQIMAGSVGGGGRQSYTVYGDPVNLAARLENLNKEYGTKLLLPQSTLDQLTDPALTKVGDIDVRGFSEPIGIYTTETKYSG